MAHRINSALWALLAALCLSACGGGGSTPEPAWQSLPDMVFTPATYVTRVDVPGSGAVFQMECTVTAREYWGKPSHVAIITRADIARTDAIVGTGMALGSIYSSAPIARVEDWLGRVNGEQIANLYPKSEGPALVNDVAYRLVLEARAESVRYTMAGYDSGPVMTRNTNPRFTGLAIARVDEPASDGRGQVEFTGCRARWSAA